MKRPLLLSAALLSAAWHSSHALAQETPRTTPVAQPMLPPGAPEEWARLTPEERRAIIERTIGEVVRGTMNHLGYTDAASQELVVKSALAQEKALEPVRAAHRRVAVVIMADARNETAITGAMNELRAAIDEVRETRAGQIAELEARLQLKQNPRLEAALSMLGITGDESSFTAGVTGSVLGLLANVGRQLG